MAFPCTQCGACCRRAVHLGLPAKRTGEQVCLYLDESTNLCTIYETRPDICRIEKMVELFGSRKHVYAINAVYCNEMQEQDGMDPRFRVIL